MLNFRQSAITLSLSALLLSPAPMTVASETTLTTLSDNDIASDQVLKPFRARYKTRYQLGWFDFDIDAERQLQHLADGNWRLTFHAEASIATLKESTEFSFKDNQIVPLEYRYRSTGMINEADRTLLFAHPLQQIHDAEKNRLITDQWQPGIQDNLTYMLQAGIDLATGKSELNYPVFQRHRTKQIGFQIIGPETIKTSLGEITAIKVEQLRVKENRQILAWFAPEHNYQLIRMTDREKGKLKYQIDITSLQF